MKNKIFINKMLIYLLLTSSTHTYSFGFVDDFLEKPKTIFKEPSKVFKSPITTLAKPPQFMKKMFNVRITKIRGVLDGSNITKGFASVTVEAVVSIAGKEKKVQLKDISFDFTNPAKSAQNIAKQLAKTLS